MKTKPMTIPTPRIRPRTMPMTRSRQRTSTVAG
jgi:hypothetical protein